MGFILKTKEKEEAIRLRSSGYTYNEILSKVKVSKGTLSIWLRNLKLSDKAQKKLISKTVNDKVKAGIAKKKFHLKKRENWQKEGRALAKKYKHDPLFTAGCMLYWGEGTKRSRGTIGMTNSDPDLILYFLSFLRKYFTSSFNKLRGYINCYTDIYSYEEIEQYWCHKLNFSAERFTKPQINNSPKSSLGKRKRKSPYGTCHLRTDNVKQKQILMGAIQEIGNFSKEEWLE